MVVSKDKGKTSEKDKTKSLDFYHVKLTFFVSLLAWPFCYILDNGFVIVDEGTRPLVMMTAGFLLLGVTTFGVAKFSKINDWLYYGISLFAFTCTIDFIITLEFIGLISGFMSEYLKFGEPYLHCPFGSGIALFDGIGFYLMYLLMAFLLANGKSWRSVAIYWAAGILNSMIVLLLGVGVGKHSPTFCTFLNVPYVLLPIAVTYRAFTQEARPAWNEKIKAGNGLKFLDIVLVLGFLISIFICLIKGLASLGSTSSYVLSIMKFEPILYVQDPAPFTAIQVLLYLFYLIPIQGLSLLSLITNVNSKKSYLWEIACIHAGATLQAQFSYIYAALDPKTPLQYQSQLTSTTFWFVNLIIVVIPHLYLYRLSFHKQNSHVKSRKL